MSKQLTKQKLNAWTKLWLSHKKSENMFKNVLIAIIFSDGN